MVCKNKVKRSGGYIVQSKVKEKWMTYEHSKEGVTGKKDKGRRQRDRGRQKRCLLMCSLSFLYIFFRSF